MLAACAGLYELSTDEALLFQCCRRVLLVVVCDDFELDSSVQY